MTGPAAMPQSLYHATAAAVEGDALLPQRGRTVAGTEGDFIFAVDDEVMAYAYSMKQGWGAKGVPAMRACFTLRHIPCVFMEGRALLPALPPGRVFILPPEGFERVTLPGGAPSGEYVRTQPIPLRETQIIEGITPGDVMGKGVQIFFIEHETLLNGGLGNFITSCRRREADYKKQEEAILEGVQLFLSEGKLLHHNAAQGILPHSLFLRVQG
ncbi:MAG: hypothetical protein GC185_06495 [Alphaproteobacteria bacterium]|nr:hypothetical protein [Alphaproteobacteria bacterium]